MNTVTYTEQVHRAIKEAIGEYMVRIEEEMQTDPSKGFGWQFPIAEIEVAFTNAKSKGPYICWRAKMRSSPYTLRGEFPLEHHSQGVMDLHDPATGLLKVEPIGCAS